MRKWLPLVAVCLSAFMLIVDTTVVVVALPQIGADLQASLASLQWVLNIYTLVLAVLTLSAGSIGDLFGHRKVFMLSLAVFGVFSLLCAVSVNLPMLIVARGLQGVGGSAMFVTSMALLGTTYEGKERGTAMGVWSAVVGAAAAAGPALGGLLTESLGWRAIFYVNVPVSLVAVVMTKVYFRESRKPEDARVDIGGIVSFALASGALTYALIRVGEVGWGAPSVLLLFALAALGLALFIVAELRHPNPMLDLSLMRNASFLALMMSTVLSAWGFSCLVFTSLWLQSVVGLTPVESGIALVPLAATTFVTATVAGKRLHGVSPRISITVAVTLMGAGCAVNGLLIDGSSGLAAVVPGLIVIGLGGGVGVPATAAAVFASVPLERVGMGSGALSTFRQLGQALGVALLGVVYALVIRGDLDGKTPDPVAAEAALTSGARTTVDAARAAGAHGLTVVYLVTAGLGLVTAVLCAVFIRSRKEETAQETSDTVPAQDTVPGREGG